MFFFRCTFGWTLESEIFVERIPPKKYFQLEFELHILQFRSTHEYFETAKYELQTPATNMYLRPTWFNYPMISCLGIC